MSKMNAREAQKAIFDYTKKDSRVFAYPISALGWSYIITKESGREVTGQVVGQALRRFEYNGFTPTPVEHDHFGGREWLMVRDGE